MSEHASQLTIDSLAAGHLSTVEAAAARAHVDGCARCQADLAAAQAACATFTRDVLPRTVATLAARASRPWWRIALPILVPVLAAAALLLWFTSRTPSRPGQEPGDDTRDIRIKGATTFHVYAKRGERVFEVRDGSRLAPGDAIRFVASSRTARYLLVASVDGAGTASVYFPFGGSRSGEVGRTRAELPGSIVLDRAPGPERIFAVFSSEPIEADVVTRALAALGSRGADAIRTTRQLPVTAADQASLVFEKDVQ